MPETEWPKSVRATTEPFKNSDGAWCQVEIPQGNADYDQVFKILLRARTEPFKNSDGEWCQVKIPQGNADYDHVLTRMWQGVRTLWQGNASETVVAVQAAAESPTQFDGMPNQLSAVLPIESCLTTEALPQEHVLAVEPHEGQRTSPTGSDVASPARTFSKESSSSDDPVAARNVDNNKLLRMRGAQHATPPGFPGGETEEKDCQLKPKVYINERGDPVDVKDRTTVMFKNVPVNLARDGFLQMLDEAGFKAQYNFVYRPCHLHSGAGATYAFVNFVLSALAAEAKAKFDARAWGNEEQMCQTSWGSPLQGYEAHVERYRSSPIMHVHIADHMKPIVLEGGVRCTFPRPTKKIRPPRLKRLAGAQTDDL